MKEGESPATAFSNWPRGAGEEELPQGRLLKPRTCVCLARSLRRSKPRSTLPHKTRPFLRAARAWRKAGRGRQRGHRSKHSKRSPRSGRVPRRGCLRTDVRTRGLPLGCEAVTAPSCAPRSSTGLVLTPGSAPACRAGAPLRPPSMPAAPELPVLRRLEAVPRTPFPTTSQRTLDSSRSPEPPPAARTRWGSPAAASWGRAHTCGLPRAACCGDILLPWGLAPSLQDPLALHVPHQPPLQAGLGFPSPLCRSLVRFLSPSSVGSSVSFPPSGHLCTLCLGGRSRNGSALLHPSSRAVRAQPRAALRCHQRAGLAPLRLRLAGCVQPAR